MRSLRLATRRRLVGLGQLACALAFADACGGRAAFDLAITTEGDGGMNAASSNGGAGAVSSAGAVNGSHGGTLGSSGSGSMPHGGDFGAGNAAGSTAMSGAGHAGSALSMAGTGHTGGAGNAGGIGGMSGDGGGSGVGSSCGVVDCPALDCALGYFPQPVPGSCCASCQPSTSITCSSGVLTYEQDQLVLVARLSTGCHTQLDCASMAVHNACEQSCVFKPLSVSSLDQYSVALSNDARAACATCPATSPAHPCPTAQLAICVNGTCVLPSN